MTICYKLIGQPHFFASRSGFFSSVGNYTTEAEHEAAFAKAGIGENSPNKDSAHYDVRLCPWFRERSIPQGGTANATLSPTVFLRNSMPPSFGVHSV